MAENIQELVSKAIVKCRNHPSILTIGEICEKDPQFSFRCVDKDEILKEIANLEAWKACQDSVLITQFISLNFHQSLNWQISLLPLKRVTEILRKTIDKSEYFQTSQKSLNDACFVIFPVLWIPTTYQSNNVALEKVTTHSIVCW